MFLPVASIANVLHLECGEIAGDLWTGPILRADELPAKHTFPVDDVGLWNLRGSVERIDALILVADGDEIDVVPDEKTMVDVGVLIHADGYDVQVRHLFLEREQAREFFNARRAPGCPEVEDDDMPAQLVQVHRLAVIVENELRCGLIDVSGMISPVASGYQQYSQEESCPDCTHDMLHFL